MLDKYDLADSGALDLRRVYAIAMKMQWSIGSFFVSHCK
jgi:hypothetical protein